MAFLTEASIELILRFSRAGKSSSYGGLMGDAYGKYGKILLQVAVLVNNLGVLIVYMIIIGMASTLILIVLFYSVTNLSFWYFCYPRL
jgi:amino acid permease